MIALTIFFKNKDDRSSAIKFNKMKEGITKEEALNLGDLIISKNIFFTDDKEFVLVEKCEVEESSFL